MPSGSAQAPAGEPVSPPMFQAASAAAAIAPATAKSSRATVWDAALLHVTDEWGGGQNQAKKKSKTILQPLDATIELLTQTRVGVSVG